MSSYTVWMHKATVSPVQLTTGGHRDQPWEHEKLYNATTRAGELYEEYQHLYYAGLARIAVQIQVRDENNTVVWKAGAI